MSATVSLSPLMMVGEIEIGDVIGAEAVECNPLLNGKVSAGALLQVGSVSVQQP